MYAEGRHNVLGVMATVTGIVLMLCAGCRRGKGGGEPAADYAIEKRYVEGALSVTLRLSGDKVAIADLVRVEIEAVTEAAYRVVFPDIAAALTGLGVRDERIANERLDAQNRVLRTRRYRLEPLAPGKASIGALAFEFGKESGDGDAAEFLVTELVEIKVTSLLEELGTNLVIEDIEGVAEIPAARWPWWAAGGAMAAAVGGIVWLRLRRREQARIVHIFRPAHEIAYEILRRLAEDKLVEAGRIKEFYERLSDCLRRYIEYRFELRAPERTTEEFLVELRQAETLVAEHREDLRQFLEHCDLVKFARYDPSGEQISEALRMVERFVDRTRSEACRVEVTGDAALEAGR